MRNKYNNVRTRLDGRSFASKGESDCYLMLKLLEKAGEIVLEKCQHTIYLSAARIAYIVDFKIIDLKTNRDVWVEYKGFETTDWRLKKRLWKHYGPGPLQIYKGYGLKMRMVEEVVPQGRLEIDDL